MSNLFIPSYSQGFARNAAESENPSLWRGLAGLWMPSLGPTGSTLRDWSGYQNHGALTNMTPASGWVATEKGYALDFELSSSNAVDLGVNALNPVLSGGGGMTWSAWIKPESKEAGNWDNVIAVVRISNNSWGPAINLRGSNGYINVSGRSRAADSFQEKYSSAGIGNGTWAHVAGVFDFAGDTITPYVNGVADGGGAVSFGSNTYDPGTPTSSKDVIGADYYTSFADFFDGLIAFATLHKRVLSPNEIQQLYIDPHALVQPRRRVFKAAAAAGNRRRRMILFAEAAA